MAEEELGGRTQCKYDQNTRCEMLEKIRKNLNKDKNELNLKCSMWVLFRLSFSALALLDTFGI